MGAHRKRSIGSTGKLALFAFFMVGAAGALTFACGSDDNAAPAADAGGGDTSTADANAGETSSTNGTIALSVTYSGTNISGTDPVLSTVWVQDQPGSAPAPSGAGQNKTASWPGTNVVSIGEMAPGSYFVFAYIMVGADHERGPIPGDATNADGVPVTVVAGQTTSVSVSVLDIPLPDAGPSDASDDGG